MDQAATLPPPPAELRTAEFLAVALRRSLRSLFGVGRAPAGQ